MICRKKSAVALTLGLALGLTTALAAAGDAPVITGKHDMVCASQDVTACVDGSTCMQGSGNAFELPVFMFVDFKKQVVRAVDEDGTTVVSPVKTHEITERSLIMQGYENHRGWTMAVDRMDGRFTLSLTGPEINFMIMGACTTL